MSPATTNQVRLATYTLPTGQQRELHAWVTEHGYLLTDTPTDPDGGREYVVERHLATRDELRALVNDYLDQAATSPVPPADIRRLYPNTAERVAA